jgi:hypothetical protein
MSEETVELVSYLARVYGDCHSSVVQLAKAKTHEDRAKVDLKLHFMKKTLDEPVRAPIPRWLTTSGRRACLLH